MKRELRQRKGQSLVADPLLSEEGRYAQGQRDRAIKVADLDAWIEARGGKRRKAPAAVGNAAHPPLMPAPGRYVLEKVSV